MADSSVGNRYVIGLLSLSVLALIALNIHLYLNFEKLSEKPNQSLKTKPPAEETGAAVSPQKRPDEAGELQARLSETEKNLDDARAQISDIMTENEEKMDWEKEQLRLEISGETRAEINSMAPLFAELNISAETQEAYKDIVVDCNLASSDERDIIIQEIRPGAEKVKDLTEEQYALYNQKYLERSAEIREACEKEKIALLGEENYNRIVEYNEQFLARNYVFQLKNSLPSDEMLTVDQEKRLVETWHRELERIQAERESTPSDEESYQEKKDSALIESARNILSNQQLDEFRKYLATQRETMVFN